MTDFSYTHDVQLVHFRSDQTEARGPVDAEGAIAAFRGFPFKSQQVEAQKLSEPTFPTISFRSAPDGATLAIWSLDPDEYEVYLESGRRQVTITESDLSKVEEIIRSYFSGDRADLMVRLSDAPDHADGRGVVSWLKGLFGRVG